MEIREQIQEKVEQGLRISDEDALYLYQDASLEDLSKWASIVRARYHDPGKASYLIMRIINYTNICVALCDYCAFYRLPKSPEGYVLPKEQFFPKIDEVLALGGDLVGFNGGFNPKLKLDWYLELFGGIRERYGERVEFYALTIAEMMYIAKISKLSWFDTATKLKEVGVRWITGGGSEILTNEFRQRHSPLKFTADEFIDAQKEVIRAGVKTTATMVIGFDESLAERVEHLRRVRELQDQTSSVFSFLSWTYKPDNTALGGEEIDQESYLRHLAVSRIYLDNVKHIRTSVLTQNENALRGLSFGADDFDIPLEDEVTELAGAVINHDVEEVLAQARAAGFEPVFRPSALSTKSSLENVSASA